MYSKEEKARRLAAAAALIKAEGLQAIFLQGNGTVGGNSLGNYRYFVDNRTNFFIACAVITPEGQLLGVVSSVMARNHLVKDSFVDNAIISPDRLGGVIKYLKENGMDKGRLGVLLEVLPASWLLRLRKELPELQLVDVSDALFAIRTQRSAEETGTLRRCGRIADEGCKAFEKAAVPGAMEHEVVADTIAAMQRCGCDNFFMLIASGRFSAEGSKMTTLHNAGGIDRCLEDGDTVSMEITPYFNGNWTQLVRTVNVGRPNPDADEFIRVTKLGIRAAAGLIKPGVPISELVKAMKEASDLPIDVHTHYTSGCASMTLLKCVEAGADIIDTAISPFAQGTSHPATEAMVESLKGSPYDTGLDVALLAEIADYFRPYREECIKSGLLNPKNLGSDIKTLVYQVPGGMLSNLTSQLKDLHAEDRFYEVLAEVPNVRKDLGECPLVTPSSQIVGSQAVMNVIQGERYKVATKETRDMLLGKYGRAVKPFNEEVRKRS